MLCAGCLSAAEARAAVNWDIITCIAAAFGVSRAIERSGVSRAVAATLVGGSAAVGGGDVGLYAGIYLATVMISNVVSNNAAATLMFPIALEAKDSP